MAKQERQSNIELLRIISMLGVIILHYNNGTIGVGFQYVPAGSTNYYFLLVLESSAACAVNLFMLISGYFSCKATRTTLQKPAKLILQVMAFSCAWNLITGIINGSLTVRGLLGSLVPTNYFVILYIVVYLLSPYLNLLYEKMNKKFIILIITVFSVWPTMVDVFSQITGKDWIGLSSIGAYGSQSGYQIVNFIMMYCIGMYLRKNLEDLQCLKMKNLIFAFVGVVALITVWSIVSGRLGYSNLAWIYCSPLVVAEAGIVFLIFSRFNLGCIKWINKLASASFTVFLVHGYFITHINIYIEWAVQQNLIVMLGHIVVCSSAIYLICFVVDRIYNFVYRIVFRKFEQNEIVISQL